MMLCVRLVLRRLWLSAARGWLQIVQAGYAEHAPQHVSGMVAM